MNWQILDEKTIWELFPDPKNRQCGATDFTKLLGACMYSTDKTCFWLATAYNSNIARIVDNYGDLEADSPNERSGAVRPALLFSEILEICPSASDVEFGQAFETDLEYPQSVVSKKLSSELERNCKTLKKTGKTYTVDSVPPCELIEVEYKGKKYVRVPAFAYDDDTKITRDGETEPVIQGYCYFVEVEKVKFLRLKDDSGTEFALPESALFTIQFDLRKDFEKHNYKPGDKIDISKHNIGRYIENHFSRDIALSTERQTEMDEIKPEGLHRYTISEMLKRIIKNGVIDTKLLGNVLSKYLKKKWRHSLKKI